MPERPARGGAARNDPAIGAERERVFHLERIRLAELTIAPAVAVYCWMSGGIRIFWAFTWEMGGSLHIPGEFSGFA